MFKSKDIERWGSGIKRIHDECVAAGIRVEFKRLKTGFEVVFYRPKWEEGEGLVDSEDIEKGLKKTRVETRGKILQIIKQNPNTTIPELSQATGLTIKGVEWNIKVLKKKELLKRIGPAKGGYWEVIE